MSMGKDHCVSFAFQVNKQASAPFMLVHFDVWGPIHVTSKLRFHFVTFVDDYSKVTF